MPLEFTADRWIELVEGHHLDAQVFANVSVDGKKSLINKKNSFSNLRFERTCCSCSHRRCFDSMSSPGASLFASSSLRCSSPCWHRCCCRWVRRRSPPESSTSLSCSADASCPTFHPRHSPSTSSEAATSSEASSSTTAPHCCPCCCRRACE